MNSRLVKVVLAALFLTVFALPASAQVYTGRIDVTAVDSTGAVLPGVTVEIGGGQKSMAVTDSRGEAHFLNLAPGKYTVSATLKGFGDYKNDSVQVGAGSSVVLKATLSVGGVTATETVKAETPMLDTKKETVSTSVSLDELQKIPSSRDPWVVLQTVPGVIVDRVNVGGAESGQQSNFQAKGASGADNTWNMDGIAITDMSATGSSPTYYDFDMFSEMNVTTGGADVTTATPGVALNFVLRSGTNAIKGSGRYYWEGHQTQTNNVTGGDLVGILGSYNRMKQMTDFGGEAGGPLVKNRLFVWGAYGKSHPELQIFTKDPAKVGNYIQTAKDETQLENISGKATAELNSKTRASFTYFRGNKQKFGRGASGTRPDETTMNQTGPSVLYKGEANLTLTNSMYVTARYAHFKNGFSLTPRSGNSTTQAYLDDNGVWHNNYYFYSTDRPQDTVSADGNYFKGNHEFKFGFSYRKVGVTSSTSWPGGAIYIGIGAPDYEAELVRDHHANASAKYYSGYLSDTFSKDRLTLNLGLRWDNQRGSLGVIDDPANAMAPSLLPHVTGTAVTDAIVWNSIAPRVGITYALDESRRTLARASYARFASQMATGAATVLSTVQYSYVYFYGTDKNGDRQVQPGELQGNLTTGAGNAGYVGFNIANPTSLTTPNKIGTYKTPMTDEFIVGADHQLTRDLSVSGSWTYRKYTNFVWNPLTGVDGNDYSVAGTLTATTSLVGPYSVPFYKINPAAVPSDSGHTYSTRPDYYRTFKGLEFSATKRMSNNWMARAAWSTNASREYFPSLASMGDPTPGPASPNINGGLVVTQTGGSGKSSIYMVLPKQQFILNGAYQMKWGITTGINYLFRTGYSQPYYRSKVATGDVLSASKSVLAVGGVDWYTLPSVHSLDGRIGKETKIDRFTVNFDIDAFNLLNVGTVLGKQYDLRLSTAGQVLEIINPRIVRFGVRIGF
jgi:hypothetical protein